MFSVVITEKGGAQRRIDFDKNEVTIGRVQGNDIILPKGNVSKRHSRIVLKDNRFIVVDLKSTNGTYVNGRKITSPLVVKSGDKIYIGDFILTLEEAAGAGAGAQDGPQMGAPPPMGGPPQMSPQPSMPQQGMAPPALPPQGGHPGMGAPPPMSPQPSPPMGAPMMSAPMGGPPPLAAQPSPQAVAPAQPAGGGRPPPLRSAPPPPRQPTLNAGGLGAPPPLPQREPQRMPSEPPPPARADRYPIDEEPADETMAPSPRVVAAARPASRPDYAAAPKDAPRAPEPAPPSSPQTEAPPARAHAMEPSHAPSSSSGGAAAVAAESRPQTFRPQTQRREAREVAPGRAPVPRARDPRDPLGYVLASIAESVDVSGWTPPEALDPDAWRHAREAIDAAIARLERDGGSPGDREALAGAALQEALGLGPLAALLDDPGVLEIVIEGPGAILVDRGAGLSPIPGRFSSADQLATIAGRLLARGGSVPASSALWEATLPDGAHVLAVLPPVAMRGPLVEIRRTGRAPITGESMVQQGLLTSDMLATLRAAVGARRNVVVVGAGDVGVSSVVSMIANLADAEDRVLAIEAAPELALAATHAVRLGVAADVSLAQLVAAAPRLRAERVVIDGVSGADTRDALLMLASRGAGCVLGVRSAPTAAPLDHLEALAGLGGGSDTIGRLLASAVHVVVKLGRDANGVRRILSIAEVTSDEGIPTAQDLWVHTGDFNATGTTASFQS